MKTNANNKGAAQRPVAATVNVACMSQKELITRLNNSNKKLQAFNKEFLAVEAKRAKNPNKVELVIDALIVKKKVIDELSESLVAATSCKEKKICQGLKSDMLLEIKYYNKLVDRYKELTGGILTTASTTIPDDIIAGEDYQVLPLLSYTTEDIYEAQKATTQVAVMSQKELAKFINTVDAAIYNTKADYAKAESKIEKSEGQDKVVAILEAMKLKKVIFDSDIELLKATKQANDKRAMAMAKSRLTFTARDYNKLVDEYQKLAGNDLTRASTTVADDIIAGRSYTILPDITYTVKDPEDGAEKDYGAAKRDAIKRARQKKEREVSAISVKAKEQSDKDATLFAKAAAFQIALLESERDSLRVGFGKETRDIKRRTKEINKEIDGIKKSAKVATAFEKRDNERYYFTVVTEPECADYPKKKVDVEKVKSLRKRIIDLLNDRDEINNKLIALYTGSEINSDGTNVNETYRRVKAQAAERLTRKGYKSAKKVHNLVATPEEKQHLFDLLNKRLDAETTLALISYRLRNEKISKKDKKLIKADADNCAKIVNQCNNDIDWSLKRIQSRQQANRSGWGVAFVIILIAVVAGVTAYLTLL